MDIDDGIVAVGAWLDDDMGTSSGAVYLFDALMGHQLDKLLPRDGFEYDLFGWSVAIDGGRVAVGGYGDDDGGGESGSAYIFDGATGGQVAKLLPSDLAGNDRFGFALAMEHETVVAGAIWDDDSGKDAGAAFVFDVSSPPSCLDLAIENLVGGKRTIFTVTGGTPGAKGLTVYGLRRGATVFDNYGGYCATFGINKISKTKVIGGYSRRFDDAGEMTIRFWVPVEYAGLRVLVQSAERGTCPHECVSSVIEMVVG